MREIVHANRFHTRPPLTLVPSAHFDLTPESEPAVRRVTCEEVDPNFFLYYHDIRLGVPSFDAEMCTFKTTPQECRLRDLTCVSRILPEANCHSLSSYSAPIIVDISYRRGRDTVQKKNLKIGCFPRRKSNLKL